MRNNIATSSAFSAWVCLYICVLMVSYVCLSLCVSDFMFACVLIRVGLCVYVYVHKYLCVCVSVCLRFSVCVSVDLFVCLSVNIYVCLIDCRHFDDATVRTWNSLSIIVKLDSRIEIPVQFTVLNENTDNSLFNYSVYRKDMLSAV